VLKGFSMTPEEKARLDILCRRIQEETDPHKATELLTQLNALLEKKEPRSDPHHDRRPGAKDNSPKAATHY
jgi:hypothetical protein